MPAYHRLILFTLRLASILMCLVNAVYGISLDSVSLRHDTTLARSAEFESGGVLFQWNLGQNELPLLSLPEAHLKADVDKSLTYPIGQFEFPIFQSLDYDEQRSSYVLPSRLRDGHIAHIIEFKSTANRNVYTSVDGSNIQLTDRETLKSLRTSEAGAIPSEGILSIDFPLAFRFVLPASRVGWRISYLRRD